MTEQEWLAATNPHPMLWFIRRTVSERKFRLFAVACCRRAWELMPSDDCREAIITAELTADGECDASVMYRLSVNINSSIGSHALRGEVGEYAAIAAERVSSLDRFYMAAEAAAVAIAVQRSSENYEPHRTVEESHQASLVRCMFGNPFRYVTVGPSWLTTDVRLLATGIYEDKAFDRLPILADALQDAGCENEEVLNHCRSNGPHVRGCWVVDLLTGRK